MSLSNYSQNYPPDYCPDVRRRVQKYCQRRRTLVPLTILVVLMAYSDTQYSPIVIEQMGARNHSRPEMQCILPSLHENTKSVIGQLL